MPTFGLEEEVFVVEPAAPSLNSLYYLARLMWRDPSRNIPRTASNFARGADLSRGLMSAVEVSTDVQPDAASLLDDLRARRAELASVADGLVVPLGHLLDFDTPTNVAALQIHVGGLADRDAAYDNLAHFLPLLALLTADSPAANGERFGQSYRMARGFATGPLGDDPTVRFQDLIVSKRLGTIEVRVLDPTWDLGRIGVLARAIEAIVSLPQRLDARRDWYNAHRLRIATEGYIDELRPLYAELAQVADVPESLLERTAADEVWDLFAREGLVPTYSAIDNGYRSGIFEPCEVPAMKASALRSVLGFAGYYVPKLPYTTWKYLKEK
jgi:gamma-glutamyl:cysteine ligase YbdK (ATP-grasp superfamily)